MSYDVQGGGDIEITRSVVVEPFISPRLTSHIAELASGIYIQGGLTGRLSHIKVKRPDGTWASILQALGVHIQLPDGTWQIFN